MMRQIQNPDMLKARRNLREKRKQERSVIKKKNARSRKRKGHAGKERAPERKKIKTGGFVDEIYEDELEPVTACAAGNSSDCDKRSS